MADLFRASAHPRLSPSGLRFVAGDDGLSLDGDAIVRGTSAQFMSESLIAFIRQPDGAFCLYGIETAEVEVVTADGFNHFSAPSPRRWAGYRPDKGVVWDTGLESFEFADPALSTDPGVWAALKRFEGNHVMTQGGPPTKFAQQACRELCWADRALAWGVFDTGRWQIAVRPSLTARVTLETIEHNEFWPQLFFVNGGLWLCTMGDKRNLVRPVGSTFGFAAKAGKEPSARLVTSGPNAGMIRVISDAGGNVLHDELFDPVRGIRVDLKPPIIVVPPVDPDPPREEPPVGVQDIPNLVDVVQEAVIKYAADWKNAHMNYPQSDPAERERATRWIRLAGYDLFLEDQRFGLNGKRGDVNDLSQDAVCFKHDDGRESVLDIIERAGSIDPEAPPRPTWSVVGFYQLPGPPRQAWVKPSLITGGGTGPNPPTQPKPQPPARIPDVNIPWDVDVHMLTEYARRISPRNRIVNAVTADGSQVEEITCSRGAFAYYHPALFATIIKWMNDHGGRAPAGMEWWPLAEVIINNAVAAYHD